MKKPYKRKPKWLLKPKSTRVKLKSANKYGAIVEMQCGKSLIRWDGTTRIVKVDNDKLEFL